MTLDELVAQLVEEKPLVEKAVIANGFSIDSDITPQQALLVEAYIDYVHAKEDEKIARQAFKYSDGEESVDKSRVYDQYRKYANDARAFWQDSKDAYEETVAAEGSQFFIRGRAGVLSERTRY